MPAGSLPARGRRFPGVWEQQRSEGGPDVTIEEAIRTAIEYETKVRDCYREAVAATEGSAGEGFFRLMGDEEQGHVDFLVARLKEWKESGAVSLAELRTTVPDRGAIAGGIATMKAGLGGDVSGAELDFLRKASEVELTTSDFYEKVVAELPEEHRGLFARFLEIERGHLALVKAQIDELTGTGYWFDVREFNLEG